MRSLFLLVFVVLSACSSHTLKSDKDKGLFQKKEKPVKNTQAEKKKKEVPVSMSNQGEKQEQTHGDPLKTKESVKRSPELEDNEGFSGRRPLVDPFVVGEKTTFDVTYFNIVAGHMTIEIKPFANINGQKSYHFFISLKSTRMFSHFYSVNDTAETYMDYEKLIPYTFHIRADESKQFRDIHSHFDWNTLKGVYRERKIRKGQKEERKEKEWKIHPFSQNIISALYYVRVFQLRPKKKLSFRVADDGENIIVRGEILRKERLKTRVGTFNTVVLKPEFEMDGIFKPTGDILIWLTDDDRKRIVRIESKIRIGWLVAKLKSLSR